MWARWQCEGAGPEAEHQKQTFQTLGLSVVCSCFGHWCRTIEVMNVKQQKHKKKKHIGKKGNEKENVKQQRQITPLQRRRCMERNTCVRTPHGKIPPPKQNSHETSKIKPLFSPVFWPPRRSGKIFEDNSCATTKTKNKKSEKWAKKQKPRKAENAIFPLVFWWFQKQELISGPGGGVFLIQLGRRRFFSPFLGIQCQRPSVHKRYYTTKIGVSALFGVPRNERKSSDFKS